MIFDFLPKDQQFFDQLERLGKHVATAAAELVDLATALPATDGHQQRIAEEDSHADKVAQDTLERLDAAFITPLDREDILHLITDLYTVVETIAALAKRAKLYHLEKLEPDLVEQARILRDVANCLSAVMQRLRKDHRLSTLNGQMKELHDLERRADERRNAFLERLFQGNPDPLEVIKQKDLHDHLELAISNCINVSRTLQRVVLKNS